jgi:CheY-like chemotaxis protein
MDDKMARILIVDNHRLSRRLLAELLRSAGYQVDEAADGWQALERVVACPVDAVLMDTYMPLMDIWETCHRLRSISPVPILILSTFTSPLIQQQALACGADACLPKPPGPDRLFSWLNSLNRTPPRRGEPQSSQRPPGGAPPSATTGGSARRRPLAALIGQPLPGKTGSRPWLPRRASARLPG